LGLPEIHDFLRKNSCLNHLAACRGLMCWPDWLNPMKSVYLRHCGKFGVPAGVLI
jgi:hypothetical protein